MPKKIPEYLSVSPVSIVCPHCKAKTGEPCERLGDEMELVHLERIEAAVKKAAQ